MEAKFNVGTKVCNMNTGAFGEVCHVDYSRKKYIYHVNFDGAIRYWYSEDDLIEINDKGETALEEECSKKEPSEEEIRFNSHTHSDKTILDEAKEIVDGLRGDHYYDPIKNFRDISVMASIMTGKDISPTDCVNVLMAVKLSRESFKPFRDNRLDLVGYAYILDKIKTS